MFDNFDYSESIIHKIISVLPLCMVILIFARFIYKRLKEKYIWNSESEHQINETRMQIAYQMHQDIGNDLNALVFKIKSWHHKNGKPNHSEYQQLEKSAIQAVNKVNDIVWSLQSEKNNLKSLVEHIVSYSNETLHNSNIAFKIRHLEKLPEKQLNIETKKNIYLLHKEAINNIVKHAQASEVEFKMVYKNKNLRVEIIDNGKGFKMNEIIKGNGLESMQQRISVLKGKIEFIENIPKGNIVKFEIKI